MLQLVIFLSEPINDILGDRHYQGRLSFQYMLKIRVPFHLGFCTFNTTNHIIFNFNKKK